MVVYFPDDEMPTCGKDIRQRSFSGDVRKKYVESVKLDVSFNGLQTWVIDLCGRPAVRLYDEQVTCNDIMSYRVRFFRCERHLEVEFEDPAGEFFAGRYRRGRKVAPLSQKPPTITERLMAWMHGGAF